LSKSCFLLIFIMKKTKMEEQSIWTAVITLVTVLGGGSAWRFYEKRAMKRERDEDFIRHDCKDRIAKLEALLESSSREKDEMRQTILKLTEQVAALSVKVEFLQSKNTIGL
jgi:CRISPR/Cas system CMR-associated protein Cmr1 (group 7 of RAMP superfamily)